MTTHDENHIIRTSPSRMLKGLAILLIPIVILGYVGITNWHFMSSIPPPVSAPKPVPAAEESATTPSGNTPASSSPPGTTITIPSGAATPGNPAYSPTELTVKKGDAITVVNDDNAPHTATGGSGPEDPNSAKSFDTGLIMAGESGTIDTSTVDAGDYPYYCTIHPFMKGTITVTA